MIPAVVFWSGYLLDFSIRKHYPLLLRLHALLFFQPFPSIHTAAVGPFSLRMESVPNPLLLSYASEWANAPSLSESLLSVSMSNHYCGVHTLHSV